MHALEVLIRVLAVVCDIRGHIPQSDGFESFRDESVPRGLGGSVAMFLTTVFCITAALALVTLLVVRGLS